MNRILLLILVLFITGCDIKDPSENIRTYEVTFCIFTGNRSDTIIVKSDITNTIPLNEKDIEVWFWRDANRLELSNNLIYSSSAPIKFISLKQVTSNK